MRNAPVLPPATRAAVAGAVIAAVTVLSGCAALGSPTAGPSKTAAPVDPEVVPHPPTGEPVRADRRCRHQWTELVQLHGENGNPGGSQQALSERWRRLETQAKTFAAQASAGDCGPVYADLRARWGGLERLQDDLHEVDMPFQLELLEGDRRHYLHFHDLPDDDSGLPGGVPAAFATLREEAPKAYDDLAALVDEAATLDVTDKAAIARYGVRLAARARASDHLRASVAAIEEIQGAELDEE